MPTLLALTLPVATGAVSMEIGGAPRSYIETNLAALALAAVWILMGHAPRSRNFIRALMIIAIALLFLPLFTGLGINGIARWLPVGPVILHVGMVCIPVLAVLAARVREYAAPAPLGRFLFIRFASPLERPARFACAGSLAGFAVMSIVANYPTPLVDYGAAPIFGYGLALGFVLKPET